MYDFLSPQWMDAAREIRARHHQQPDHPVSVRINFAVSHVPFGDDDTVFAYIDTSSGEFEFELGQLDGADALVMTDYEVAKALIVGAEPAALMQVFLEGRLKVQGDMTRLMVLQANMPSGEIAQQIGEELRAVTN
jgi:putative sterol carrier protein